MAGQKRRTGFTLIEIMIVVAIVGVITLASVPAFNSWTQNTRTRAAARSMADLLLLARSQAIRSSIDHLVFFQTDADGAALTDSNGNEVLALLTRDLNGDGMPTANEYMASVPIDSAAGLSWGFNMASLSAPGDPDATMTRNWTFREPDGATPANWVLFRPDGLPRAFKVGSFERGEVGSGAGAVYLTSGRRDYAIVLAPLGGVRVESWNAGGGQW
jgi:prepilin-type N-terminal cleavage/methylation domain-containing protein